ncbi:MAG: phage tail protein I [Synergistaceae bacterium]|nr:phage tail protein I [Synergistaceae bacterium]
MQANSFALTPEFRLLAEDVKRVLIYPNLDEWPEPILDLLAWEQHVDFYELAKTAEAKREVIRGAPAWHRKKGTVWAILKALEMFGIKGTYTNWYEMEPRGKPGTFAIDAELTEEYWERSDWSDPVSVVRRAVVESKAGRSWMSGLRVHIDDKAVNRFYAGIAVGQGQYHSIGLPRPVPAKAAIPLQAGIVIAQCQYHRIGLSRPTSSKSALNVRTGGVIAQSQYQTIPRG